MKPEKERNITAKETNKEEDPWLRNPSEHIQSNKQVDALHEDAMVLALSYPPLSSKPLLGLTLLLLQLFL